MKKNNEPNEIVIGRIKAGPLVKVLEHILFCPYDGVGDFKHTTYSKTELKELMALYKNIAYQYDALIKGELRCRVSSLKKKKS